MSRKQSKRFKEDFRGYELLERMLWNYILKLGWRNYLHSWIVMIIFCDTHNNKLDYENSSLSSSN